MRHQRRKFKIGNNPSHRKALIKNLANEVIDHGKIKTTFEFSSNIPFSAYCIVA